MDESAVGGDREARVKLVEGGFTEYGKQLAHRSHAEALNLNMKNELNSIDFMNLEALNLNMQNELNSIHFMNLETRDKRLWGNGICKVAPQRKFDFLNAKAN